MITSFTAERFKSLVDFAMDLGRINVFIGANGSGKSNILEAVGVLGAAASGRVDAESLLRRGVRPGAEQLYKSAFPDLPTVPHIRLQAVAKASSHYEVTLWNPSGGAGPTWKFKTEVLERAGTKVAGRSPASLDAPNQEQGLAALETFKLPAADSARQLMDSLRNYAIYCPNTPTLRGLERDQQQREPVGLAGGRLAEAIVEVQNAARTSEHVQAASNTARDLIDWASGFSAKHPHGVGSPLTSVPEVQFTDRFMAEGRNVLTGYDASEGSLYVLFYLVLAMHRDAPRLLAVDNLDQALNPLLAKRMMSAIGEWVSADSQWLITTHNPAALDGLPLKDPSVRLFAVDRDSRGHTVASPIDLVAAMSKRPSEDWTLSRMWMNGLLGAVPNV